MKRVENGGSTRTGDGVMKFRTGGKMEEAPSCGTEYYLAFKLVLV